MKNAAAAAMLCLLVACGSGGDGTDLMGGLDIQYDGTTIPDQITTDTVADAGDTGMTGDTGDCEIVTSSYGFRNLCDGTVKDTNTGLMWQRGYGEPDGLLPNNTIKYCNGLKLGYNSGTLYEDWRAPTIDELRSLIVGCEKTELGGSCPLLHDCVSSTCLGGIDPYQVTGCSCTNGGGPVEFPDDDPNDEWKNMCYLDDTFEPWCNLYYSQTIAPKGSASNPERMMYVTFYDGKVKTVSPGYPNASAYVKCVRGTSTTGIPCVTNTTDNTPGCVLAD